MRDAEALKSWVARLTQSELPVLKHTARDLTALRQDEMKQNARTVANVIARDPLMTVKLLRYLQRHKHRAQTTEAVQIEHALLMIGLDPFFNNVAAHPLAEEMFAAHAVALVPMLRVVQCSRRASEYAKDWAVLLHDLRYEEVRIAALLRDTAKILMWCFATGQMLEIHDLQLGDKTLRSSDVQEQVLGFTLFDLQKELALQWNLPGLLLTLMDDPRTQEPRVRIVALAVNLARHSANGWDDAALPDDYKDISDLLRIPIAQVLTMFGRHTGIAHG